jgi:hypothetical protein
MRREKLRCDTPVAIHSPGAEFYSVRAFSSTSWLVPQLPARERSQDSMLCKNYLSK